MIEESILAKNKEKMLKQMFFSECDKSAKLKEGKPTSPMKGSDLNNVSSTEIVTKDGFTKQ